MLDHRGLTVSVHAAILLVVATFVFVMTPGPGIFALISRALSRGPLAAAVLALGLIAADFMYLTCTLAGLAFVAQRFHGLFAGVKVVGAIYLVWLGVRTWRAPPRPMGEPVAIPRGLWRDFMAGVVTSGSNPKVMLFYMGFLPAFVELAHMTAGRYALIAVLVTATLLVGCLIYIALCARMRRLFASAAAVRRLNRIAGVALVGAGVGVASS